MRQEADFFKEPELKLIYLARTLRDSLKLEDLFTNSNIDYLVETGPYTAGFLIKRELTGVYFYVAPGDLARARDVMTGHGYKPFSE